MLNTFLNHLKLKRDEKLLHFKLLNLFQDIIQYLFRVEEKTTPVLFNERRNYDNLLKFITENSTQNLKSKNRKVSFIILFILWRCRIHKATFQLSTDHAVDGVLSAETIVVIDNYGWESDMPLYKWLHCGELKLR